MAFDQPGSQPKTAQGEDDIHYKSRSKFLLKIIHHLCRLRPDDSMVVIVAERNGEEEGETNLQFYRGGDDNALGVLLANVLHREPAIMESCSKELAALSKVKPNDEASGENQPNEQVSTELNDSKPQEPQGGHLFNGEAYQ